MLLLMLWDGAGCRVCKNRRKTSVEVSADGD
jgi:hypothetical protein